jgi:hypothetical protein
LAKQKGPKAKTGLERQFTCDKGTKHKVDNGHYDSTKATNTES